MSFSQYNSQLVSLLLSPFPFQLQAEFTSEDAFEYYHIYHQSSSSSSHSSSHNGGPVLPALGHALAGGVASALSKAVVYPIDTIVTRMQVQNSLKGDGEAPSAASDADASYTSPIDAARKIYANEGGLRAFYTGVGPDVVKGLADSFLFFLAYSAIRQGMLARQSRGGGGSKQQQLPVLKELSVGVLAGAFSKAITAPIQNIVTRQQTAALIAARNPSASSSTMEKESENSLSIRDIARQIHSEKGISGFWSGYSANSILTLNPAITFAVDNLMKSLLTRSNNKSQQQQSGDQRNLSSSATVTFLIAALSKVVATAIMYPVTLAKSRAQASGGGQRRRDEEEKVESHKQKSLQTLLRIFSFSGQIALYHSLRKIHRTEGLAGLYSGIEGELLKGFLSHGLTMTGKDHVMGGIVRLWYLLLRLRGKWEDGEGGIGKGK